MSRSSPTHPLPHVVTRLPPTAPPGFLPPGPRPGGRRFGEARPFRLPKTRQQQQRSCSCVMESDAVLEDAAAAAAGEGDGEGEQQQGEVEVVVQIGAQKHDPAWKHCVMVRSDGRLRLRCAYCGKHFLGGGIHRFKEHLARRPGNACCCPKVPRDVQDTMLRSLDAVAAKKMQRKLAASLSPGDMRRFAAASAPPASVSTAGGGTGGSPIHMIPLNEVLDFEPVPLEEQRPQVPDGSMRGSTSGKKKRKQVTYAPAPPLTPQAQPQHVPPPTPQTNHLHGLQHVPPTPQTNSLHQVVMAVDAVAPAEHLEHAAPSEKEQVSMAVGRFLYDAGVPLEAVNSVYFQPMLEAIAAAGGRPEVLTYHDIRGHVLKRSLNDVMSRLEFFRGSWTRTGCSVLADEWITDKGRTLINFSVYCPEGTMFLKSVDATSIVTSSDALYELLKCVVEEVGEKKVIQVITSNSEIHAAAGKKLGETFPTLFWSPCTFQCVDGMLEDFSKVEAISEIISNAKTITGFVYNSAYALNLMKKYLQGKDLLVHAETRAAMNFVTLKNMYSLREALQAMVNSDEWIDLLSKKGGIEASNIVNSVQFWNSCAAVVHMTDPLVHLLKLVSSNKRPSMGYVYAGLYKAKAAIKKELVSKNDCMVYWNIIDWRWDNQTPQPLHSAGFVLNPLFFDGIQGDISNGIFSGMLDCIERLVSDVKIQDKIQRELHMYRRETAGDFRRQMAVRSRRTLPPAEWWYTYGGACPNLTRLAVRILSQTCSARGCDRTNIPFEQVHDERMNSFERQRMHDLTFVQYNLRLTQRQQRKVKTFDPLSVDYIDVVDDWVVDRPAMFSGPAEQPNWMEINQSVKQITSREPTEDEFESFIEGVDDEMIQGAAQGFQEDEDDPACG